MSDSPPSTPPSGLVQSFRDGRGPALWLMGLVVGLVAGYATLGLRLGIGLVEQFAFGVTEEHLASTAANFPVWRRWAIPVITGIVISLMLLLGDRLGLLKNFRSRGVPDVIEARAVGKGQIEIKSGLFSALMACISLGGGGSAGREGPAVHLGGTLASLVSRLVGLNARGSRILLACGAAAAVSASFNAPVARAGWAMIFLLARRKLIVPRMLTMPLRNSSDETVLFHLAVYASIKFDLTFDITF